MEATKSKSGIIVPKKGVLCGYCPRFIFKEQEGNGKLKMVDGRPMCPTCRAVKLSRFQNQINSDKARAEKDMLVIEKIASDKENQRVLDIAMASQQRNKKSKNKK